MPVLSRESILRSGMEHWHSQCHPTPLTEEVRKMI
jgi:hypothetical protein